MPRKSRKRKGGILWKLLISAVLILIVAAALFLGSIRLGLFGALPGKEELKKLESYTAARILASDGELLGLYYVQNRTHTDLSTLPGYLVNALIATEDARFYNHHGIDFRSIMRVIVKSLLLGDRSSGGGSTISQQLAKNLYLSPVKSMWRKIAEAILTWKLERDLSKKRILELYLNLVEWGEGIFGAEAASRHYFGKNSIDLTPLEAARLAAILPNPRRFDPTGNQGYIVNRSHLIYGIMIRRGVVNSDFEGTGKTSEENALGN